MGGACSTRGANEKRAQGCNCKTEETRYLRRFGGRWEGNIKRDVNRV